MIHIAIVSHGHENLLITGGLGGLLEADAQLKVWLKDNKPSVALKQFCAQHAVAYTDASPGLGFGDNNNFLFEQIGREAGFQAGDSFIVMNPDIATDAATLRQLVRQMRQDAFPLATLNLYRDAGYRQADTNIRRFPDLWTPLRALRDRSLTRPYDKAALVEACHVDWASGALLAFDAAHYQALQGFDPHYFMYFEDVDLCYRSRQLLGKGVRYYPQLRAIHAAARQNRQLGSRHASWFFRSFLTFLARRYFVYGRRQPRPQAV
ncbi:MAG: glycosyltransferase family 2 protein [Burkholderiales bacterium]|nr:glycosyltransferase family 2 protein [Burkholderiales bacterium]